MPKPGYAHSGHFRTGARERQIMVHLNSEDFQMTPLSFTVEAHSHAVFERRIRLRLP
jgi:hypothetical protein